MYLKLRRITALLILVLITLTLVSCGENRSEAPDNFVYTEIRAIPEADIIIAYLYSDTPSLSDSLSEVNAKLKSGNNRIYEFQISEDSPVLQALNKAFACGCNVIVSDKGIPCNTFTAQIKANPDKFFIAYCDESVSFDNLICFEDSYLEYNYILGVLSAKLTKSSNIGIRMPAPKTASEYAEINSFAAGVRIVNSNISIIVSDNDKTLSSEKCDYIFVPSGMNNGNSENKTVGYDIVGKSSISLITDHTVFLSYVISSVTDGTFNGNDELDVGVNYGLCDNSLEDLSGDETLTAQINTIKDYFVKGMKIFSNNVLMISGDEIISVTEPVIDSNGNTLIDDAGNLYYYDGDGIRLCNDYEALVNEKMNYLYDNVSIKN